LDEAGFGGGEIQPFNFGLPGTFGLSGTPAPAVNDYLTPTFFNHVRTVVNEASKREMWIDSTFGSGWPFGGRGTPPNLAAKEIQMGYQSVHGPVSYNDLPPLPPLTAPPFYLPPLPPDVRKTVAESRKIVALTAFRGSAPVVVNVVNSPFGSQVVTQSGIIDLASGIDLMGHLDSNGVLHWNVPPGDWQLIALVQNLTGEQVDGGVGNFSQYVIDHLNREAIEAHIKAVGDPLKNFVGGFFGSTFRAVFCDNFELTGDLPWTSEFLSEFKRRRGYDLTPFLPLLRQPGLHAFPSYASLPYFDVDSGHIGDEVRSDYWRTVSDLMLDNFFIRFSNGRQTKVCFLACRLMALRLTFRVLTVDQEFRRLRPFMLRAAMTLLN
jgi:hypothetical protein